MVISARELPIHRILPARFRQHCLQPVPREEILPAALKLDDNDPRLAQLQRGAGCKQCFGSGYFGRIGIYEVLLMTPEIRTAIVHGEGAAAIRELAREQGMLTLDDAVRAHVLDGTTTLQEYDRVLASF